VIRRSTVVNEYKRKRSLLLCFLVASAPWAVYLLWHWRSPLSLSAGIAFAVFALLNLVSFVRVVTMRADIESRIAAEIERVDRLN
jgi:hypothetical protein